MIYVVETGHYVTSTCDLTEEQFDRFREMYEKYCKTYDVKEDLAEDGLLSNVPHHPIGSPSVVPRFAVEFLENWSDIDAIKESTERMKDISKAMEGGKKAIVCGKEMMENAIEDGATMMENMIETGKTAIKDFFEGLFDCMNIFGSQMEDGTKKMNDLKAKYPDLETMTPADLEKMLDDFRAKDRAANDNVDIEEVEKMAAISEVVDGMNKTIGAISEKMEGIRTRFEGINIGKKQIEQETMRFEQKLMRIGQETMRQISFSQYMLIRIFPETILNKISDVNFVKKQNRYKKWATLNDETKRDKMKLMKENELVKYYELKILESALHLAETTRDNFQLAERRGKPAKASKKALLTTPSKGQDSHTESISDGAAPITLTVDERLRRHLNKYPEDEQLSSVDLGKKIGADDAAIRKTKKWKEITKMIALRKEMERISLQLNNEYLPIEKREALNEELEALVKQVDRG